MNFIQILKNVLGDLLHLTELQSQVLGTPRDSPK